MRFKILFTWATVIFSFSCQSSKDIATSVDKSIASPPLMGWASWNNYRANINERIIEMQVDAMASHGLMDYGYSYINIDDGFFGGRDADGVIMANMQKFPKGMKHISTYIHGKGLKAGIYSDAGINTCASYYDKDTIGVGMGLYGHDKQDLTTFLKDWDYDFLKVDWCGGEKLYLNEETRYTEIGNLARRIKPDVIYNVCRWKFPGQWVTGIANSWRISSDLDNNFESVLNSIDKNADLWQYASYGHYNDMDMLQIGRGMTKEEDRTQFSMWCLMHSPLVLGNDLTTLSEQTKAIITNKELIAINQSKYVYQARKIIDEGELEVWGKPLVSTMSGQVVVALLNRSNEPKVINFKVDAVGIDPTKGYTIKDLWSKEMCESSQESILTKLVPAHGVIVLKITGESMPFNVFQQKDKK
jgi:hypothetical protein